MAANAEPPEVSADPAALDAARGIYESSFEPAELVDFDELRADVRRGGRRSFVARAADGAATGFGITRLLAPVRVQLLEYFAVAEERRGTGVGGSLLDELVAELRRAGDADRMLLEVERPDLAGRHAERRIAFYERHGARVVECAPDYRAPRCDGPGELLYLLMWAPLADGAAEPRGEELQAAVRELLVDVYELGPDAPLVRQVVGALTC